MSNLHIPLEHDENQKSVEYIMTEAVKEDFSYPQVSKPVQKKSILQASNQENIVWNEREIKTNFGYISERQITYWKNECI